MSAPAPHSSPKPPPFRQTRQVVAVLVGFLLVASAAVAGVLVTYNTSSTQTLSLKAPPVQWAAGADSSGNGFVASWSLSGNHTYYSIQLSPVPEANVTWGNLTTLTNTDTSAWTVQVSGTNLASYSKITTFRLEFYNPGGVVAALNLTSGTTTVSLGSMAPNASLSVRATIQLAAGTGAQDLPASVDLSLAIS